jgi:hypothetical protein
MCSARRSGAIAIAAVALLTGITTAGTRASAQDATKDAAAPIKPYKPVPVTMPEPMKDKSFEAFRKQLGEIAAKKDRAALGRLVIAKDFFWITEDGDNATKDKPGIDNLAAALKLSSGDGGGWDLLSGYALEPTAVPIPDRQGVICAPADPSFDENQLNDLAKATQTDPGEWGYPLVDGLEVRSGPQPNAPVIEKLGTHLVRVLPDAAPAASGNRSPPLKVVAPSGKTGFVPIEDISPIGNDQLCYAKDASGWKITGFIGGEP